MEGNNRTTIIATWLKKYRMIYSAATRHPFILGIRDGSVYVASYKRWLGQDYMFVKALVPFVASLLLKAWKESDDKSDVGVILGGIAALNDEIFWFEGEAAKWHVALESVVPQQATLDYCRFLESLMSSDVDYTQAITAFWVIETVYQESFAHCLEFGSQTPLEIRETCERWGNAGFGRYCRKLQNIASRRLEKASHDVLAKAERNLLHALEHEVRFWNMSHGGD